MIRIPNLKQDLSGGPGQWPALAAGALSLPVEDILQCRLCRKAVDARDKRRIHLVLTLDVQVRGDEGAILARCPKAGLTPAAPPSQPWQGVPPGRRPVVVGMGPAGLFAALALAEAGWRPLLVERGKAVEARRRDVAAFHGGGILDPQSNVQFGEGGAGTFSDGKLATGIKDPRCPRVLRVFAECGAPEEILTLAKPHIGTDNLPRVVRALRERIVALGGEALFETRLTGLHIRAGRIRGVTLEDGQGLLRELETDHVILAIGHSARDTYAMLEAAGVCMQAKAFSLGVRVEHPQAFIDQAQYGAFAGHAALGPAEYKLAVHLHGGRDLYTFCMCPGGTVVGAASEPGGVVTNGMSPYRRDGLNANSALLVGVTPEIYGPRPLDGIAYQRAWERAAFEAGGCSYRAPAQRMEDFLRNRPSQGPGSILPSYRPGVSWTSLDPCLPRRVTDALREGIRRMDRMLQGFAMPDAVLTGVETRSSSPVRIPRGADGQSLNCQGLYPAGEGAGYAGGILSAAVDGLRAAEAALRAPANP